MRKDIKMNWKKIYNSLTSAIGKDNLSPEEEDNLKRFIGVNLVKKSDEESVFGYETIIKNIYTYLNNESIILRVIKEKDKNIQNNSEQKEPFNWDDILSILKDNSFFEHLKNYKEIEEKYENEARDYLKKAKIKIGFLGIFPLIDIISGFNIQKSLKNEIENSFRLNEIEIENAYTLNENKEEKKGLFNNLLPSGIKSNEQSFALNLLQNGVKFINFEYFIISKKGEEMIELNLKKFREINYNMTLSLIDSVLKGIEFFEKLSLDLEKKILVSDK